MDRRTSHRAVGRRRSNTAGPGVAPAHPGRHPRHLATPPHLARALAGALLVVGAVAASLTVYRRAGDRVDVLATTRAVPAGQLISAGDIRTVAISTDAGGSLVPASRRDAVVGQHAAVHLAAGAFLVPASVQAEPLVRPGFVSMALELPVRRVPAALGEGSRVVLVLVPYAIEPDTPGSTALVHAVVASIRRHPDVASSADGTVSLSVEVSEAEVAVVGSAELAAVGVLDPATGPPSDSTPTGSHAGPAFGAALERGPW